jgi:hypothetical protein
VLVWKGKFKRKVADNPPAGQDDAGVRKAISGAYQAGLQNVKKMAESKVTSSARRGYLFAPRVFLQAAVPLESKSCAYFSWAAATWPPH